MPPSASLQKIFIQKSMVGYMIISTASQTVPQNKSIRIQPAKYRGKNLKPLPKSGLLKKQHKIQQVRAIKQGDIATRGSKKNKQADRRELSYPIQRKFDARESTTSSNMIQVQMYEGVNPVENKSICAKTTTIKFFPAQILCSRDVPFCVARRK